ncbi:MAG: TetR/AcrR family transcriptional regulator, partial [Propionicimonas sp.]|nr:TetR/AcrR family transcriptional regulator [Propionicimonas sp.]
MSRPCRDAARPPARERVEAAFWELLSERPYREITIAALARRAQVNHNTFYYHFTSLADLAGQQVDRTLTPRVPQALVSALSSGAVDLRQLDADPEFLAIFRRICLLVGPHSTPWIIDQVR